VTAPRWRPGGAGAVPRLCPQIYPGRGQISFPSPGFLP